MNNNHNLNSSQLELFVAITDQGSFSEAARVLGITPSAVSHGLARLETELGLILIDRGRRGVTLTNAGQEILPHARDVAARLSLIHQIAAAAEGTARGKLRLGITYPLSPHLFTEMIVAFQNAHPEVETVVVDDVGLDSKTWLADGLIDVGVVLHPAPGVDSRLLWEDEICAVIAPLHPLAAKKTVELDELLDEPLILPRLGREAVREALRRREGTAAGRPQLRHLVSDTEMVLEMVRKGVGIALLPRTAFAEQNALLTVSLSPPLSVPIGLAVRSWEAAPPVAKRFVEAAEKWAAELAGPRGR